MELTKSIKNLFKNSLLVLGVILVISILEKLFYFYEFVNQVSFISGFNSLQSLGVSSLLLSIGLTAGIYIILSSHDLISLILYLITSTIFTVLATYLMFLDINTLPFMLMNIVPFIRGSELTLITNVIVFIGIMYLSSNHIKRNTMHVKYKPFLILMVVSVLLYTVNFSTYSETQTSVLPITEFQLDQLDSMEILYLDARLDFLYERGHIEGAISIPFLGNETDLSPLNNYDIKKYVVVAYCDASFCSSSMMLAEIIAEKYKIDVFYLKEGYVSE